MCAKEREYAETAMPFRAALRGILAVQVLFNLALPVLVCGAVYTVPEFSICVSTCTLAFWGLTGVASALLLRQLYRSVIQISAGTQFVCHLVYVVQILEHGLFVVLVGSSYLAGAAMLLPLAVSVTGLGLGLLSNILLAQFMRANPALEFDVNSRPMVWKDDSSEMETTGEWDEGRK